LNNAPRRGGKKGATLDTGITARLKKSPEPMRALLKKSATARRQ
jgi:hypothetical protein